MREPVSKLVIEEVSGDPMFLLAPEILGPIRELLRELFGADSKSWANLCSSSPLLTSGDAGTI